MTALRVARVEALEFGRHRQVDVDDLDHDFVVVYGPNESGKSTLAEFLSWAIGGPWRTFAKGSQRFRSRPEVDTIGGRVIGSLGDDRFDLSAVFKLLARGQPSDLRSIEVAGKTHEAADISKLFGGLSAEDYVLIYRLYGIDLVDLESGENFSDLFTTFALDSTHATINPRRRLGELNQKCSSLDTEIKRRKKDLVAVRARISQAAANPEEVREIASQLGRIAQRTAELDLELAARRDQLTDVDTARAARGARDEQRAIADELVATGRLPAGWVPVVAVADQIGQIRDRLDTLDDELVVAHRDTDTALAAVAVTEDACRRHGWTLADRVDLQSTHHKVVEAEKQHADADQRLEEIRARSRRVAEDLREATGSLSIPNADARRFVDQETTVRSLRTLVATWSAAHSDLLAKRADHAGAEAELAAIDAEPDPDPAPARPVPWPFFVAVLAAAGLAFLHPVAAVAGVLAVAVVWLLVDRRFAGRRATTTLHDTQADRRRRAYERTSTAASALATATAVVDSRTADFRAEIAEFGLEVPSPTTAAGWLDDLERLVAAADAARQLEIDHQAAVDARAVADAELADHRRALAEQLAQWGVTTTPAGDDFFRWIDDFGTAHHKVAELDRLLVERDRTAVELDRLLAPVAESVDLGRPWPLIEQELARYRAQAARIAELESDLKTAEAAVRAARADQPEIAALLDRYRSDEAFDGARRDLEATIAELESEHTALVEHRTNLHRRRDELEAVEVLPELHLEQGDVEADLAELEAERVATGLAAQILSDVIDDYERNNQDPLIQRAQGLIGRVVDDWGTLMYSRSSDGKVVIERDGDGGRLDDSRLSDGGRALLYLGIRLAFAERDLDRRGLALPLLCDDPLIHFDDRRTVAGLELLRDVADRHQVIMFTCEETTRDLARGLGAHIVHL